MGRLTKWVARHLDYFILGYLFMATVAAYLAPPDEQTIRGWAFLLAGLGLLIPIILVTQVLEFASQLRGAMTLIPASGFSVMLFASVFQTFGIRDGNGDPLNPDTWTAVYFSIVTWTTLGYGDFSPNNDTQIIAALEAVLGYLVMALIIGFAVTAIRDRDQKRG